MAPAERKVQAVKLNPARDSPILRGCWRDEEAGTMGVRAGSLTNSATLEFSLAPNLDLRLTYSPRRNPAPEGVLP